MLTVVNIGSAPSNQAKIGYTVCKTFTRSDVKRPHEPPESRAQPAAMPVHTPSKIMIVEDDPAIKRLLELILGAEGFTLAAFDDGAEALGALEDFQPDLVLLDLILPQLDGLEFARTVRAQRHFDRLPLVAVTARAHQVDRYEAFSAGVDDYVIKPFDPMELVFRVRSSLRLTQAQRATAQAAIEVGALRLEPARYHLSIEGREVILTKLETALLSHLMTHAGQVFSADHLAKHLASLSKNPVQRSVDAAHAHIRHLRQKIEMDPKTPRLIVTMGRKGYYFAG